VYHQMRWTAQKIAQRIELIEPLVYRKRSPLPSFRFLKLNDPMDEPPIGADVDDSQWQVIEANSYWATSKVDFVLRTTFQVPVEWDANRVVALYLPLGEPGSFSHPEGLAYFDGDSYATCDRHHQEIQLPQQWRDGQTHLLALHGWTGNSNRDGEHGRLLMRECAVVQIDQPTRDFVALARVALGIEKMLDDNNPAKDHLLNALDAAFKLLDTIEPFGDEFYASISPAYETLKAGIAKAGPPMEVSITASGHAHIDVAWLWTLGQTRRKSGRTFHTVMRLMEQFPDYHFTQSQPQVYDYVRQDYPALFEDIKARISDGRWEPIGGMWVEADCNLSGPESLARQFLLGRTFFRDHFGADAESPVLWLPDVFGYAWALPQLIKQAGLDYFFTIKIGWSQYNRLPYDSFWWQGVDGTRVLTHFSTTKDPASPYASTYNSVANPEEAMGTWVNFQQKALQNDLLMAFGYGDGGGGPTREMLENIREMGQFPSAPQMRQRPVGDFFRDLEANSGDKLPTWNGELYLELHRGTYTTQSRNKRANRKSEFLLHDAEFVAALAAQLDSSYSYPKEIINKAWELICLNQFHDIIPGSSINPVYVESQQQYAEIRQMAEQVRCAALDAIASTNSGAVLVANPTSFTRSDLAFLPSSLDSGQQLQDAGGSIVPTQNVEDGVLIAAQALPPFSVTGLSLMSGSAAANTSLSVSKTHLENDYLLVELNEDGDITRIYDKANVREVLPEGAIANQLQAFEDRPMNWDAWDIDIFYDDKMWLSSPAESVTVVEAGPLRATLEIRRNVLHSPLIQRISLAYNSPRLDFDTWIDWHERHVMLKVAFPVDVLTPTATHEIQWGNVERPTHRNTSWDWARFETAAQKWVDLSEGGYGVSLLNDCKYGHDVRDNVMRISLLRAPTMPDPEADQGEHRFAYALLPHAGRWNEDTIAAAYAFNDPLIAWSGKDSGASSGTALVQADQPNIVIETIKQAEDGNGVIVRLYESQRKRGPIQLTAGFDLGAVWHTNLLEDNQALVEFSGHSINLNVHPYEIVTLRLVKA
jgi:alpha-mannosidase